METATPAQTHQHDDKNANGAQPEAIDPTNEIDAKTTTIVLVISTIFVFGTVWILSYIFAEVMFQERVERVEQAPTEQLEALRLEEAEMLGAGNGRISIEDSMKELTNK